MRDMTSDTGDRFKAGVSSPSDSRYSALPQHTVQLQLHERSVRSRTDRRQPAKQGKPVQNLLRVEMFSNSKVLAHAAMPRGRRHDDV